MKPVRRDEVMGLADYETVRDRFRARVIEEKRARRVKLGDKVSAVFENHDTVLLQIQEMLRTERITREAGVQHEIDTYNPLVPGNDELSATVLIEVSDPDARAAFLRSAVGFEKHVALVVDGERCAATSGPLDDTSETPAVHYLKFPLSPKAAAHLRDRRKEANVEMIVDHPAYSARVAFPPAMLVSLAEDLD